MKKQDFSQRITLVVNSELPSWQILNTVSHISAYFGNLLEKEFGTAPYFTTLDGIDFPRNTQYPIIILGAKKEALQQFAEKMKASKLKTMFFIREMIETTDDENIEALLSLKNASDVEILGVGLFGLNAEMKEATREFKLYC